MLKINSKIEILRKKFFKKEKIQILSQILNPFFIQEIDSHFKKYFFHVQQKMMFNLSMTKIRAICLLTGRTRAVYRTFHTSRLKLKYYANAGYFTGLSKVSW